MKSYISPILIIVFLIALCLAAVAQPPNKMTYQAVIRDGQNMLVPNRTIGVKISILQTFPNGIAIYEETHQATTNGNGLLSLEVGTGTPTPGSNFSAIDWAHDNFYLQSEIDLNGGNQYTLIGSQQLITVPYSFHSGTSIFSDSSDYNNLLNRPVGQNTGDILYWDANQSDWQVIPVGSAGQVLTLNPNGIPQWYSTVFNQNTPPTITTDTVYNITGRTATVVSTIVNSGTTGIIASGVCWSTTPNPSLGNNYTTDGTSVGSFISQVSGLTSGTVFYVRAYATNSIGTSYGTPISFTTPTHCGSVTDYDSNVYNTIYIGAQCWMKENLKTTHYSNGATITKGQALTTSIPSSGHKYYYEYGDDSTNVPIYGLLYSWAAVMNGAGSSSNNPSGIQGICPSGWHVPSNTELCELENYIEPGIDVNCNSTGYRGSMANKLAVPRYWDQYDQNSFAPGYWPIDTIGFNDSGFSGLPGGRYNMYFSSSGSGYNTANYEYLNTYGFWWSCTMDNNNNIFYRYLNYQNSGVYLTSTLNPLSNSTHYYAYSVRCVKN